MVVMKGIMMMTEEREREGRGGRTRVRFPGHFRTWQPIQCNNNFNLSYVHYCTLYIHPSSHIQDDSTSTNIDSNDERSRVL